MGPALRGGSGSGPVTLHPFAWSGPVSLQLRSWQQRSRRVPGAAGAAPVSGDVRYLPFPSSASWAFLRGRFPVVVGQNRYAVDLPISAATAC